MTDWAPLDGSTQAVALEVLLHGPLGRAELSRRTGLSQASLSRLTRPLVDAGLLVEVEPADVPAGRGRPAQPLDVAASAHAFVGVNLTGDDAVAVLTDLRATVLAHRRVPLADHAPDAVLEVVAGLVRELAAEAPGAAPLEGVGVSLGGQTTPDGTVRRAPFLGWRDVPAGPALRSALDRAVTVDNDLVARTEAEHWFGAGREHPHFALLTVGAGVGLGLVVHDRLVQGPDAGLGLVGHHRLALDGPRCSDGHRGCASAFVTQHGVQGAVAAAVGRWVDYDEALDLAVAGHPGARRAVDDAGRALGRLVAAVANVAGTPTVVLGGEGVRLASVASEALASGLAEDRDPEATPVGLVVRPEDRTQWPRGAAVRAIQAFVTGAGR
ncbi:ROK family transcriptional regulator [Cellulomonas marina]|uniref:Sugar kinase of the NBD/HSP70 family, may contain an N-terminal HTH domain n=1 Tax=Cellulomonas marina TaxID=988821 RepID=A0A1I0WRP2_9CELL|nr:ROK family transcriptional regulator [Cellulomonas marina]GIG27795.1 MarR family transcriptional regulator [Cellulomonas marina]SFA90656.1 Sugar kinase of the NBD/HSP70 family, may contain an N-terminal HTH domain [Cellulomonas marina]